MDALHHAFKLIQFANPIDLVNIFSVDLVAGNSYCFGFTAYLTDSLMIVGA